MRPLYKCGGKIKKGRDGLELPKLKSISMPAVTQNEFSWYGEQLKPNPDKTVLPKLNGVTKIQEQRQTAYANKNPYDQGGLNEKIGMPDLNVPLNWLRAFYSMSQSDKQLKNFLNRPRYYMSTPLLNSPRFIDSGQKQAYINAANRTRMYKPVTSDSTRNDAAMRQRQADATNLELQGNLAHSQEIGKYHAMLDEFNNQNTLRNTEIANQNRHFDFQHDIEDVQAKNANIAEKSKFFDQAAYATQEWYNTKLNQWRAKDKLAEMTTLQNNFNRDYNDWKTKWAGKEDTPEAKSVLANLMSNYSTQRSLLSLKSGGKTSRVTYSRNPYPELLLQNSKNSDRFVEKLNDSVIKLILQTKPIHVH